MKSVWCHSRSPFVVVDVDVIIEGNVAVHHQWCHQRQSLASIISDDVRVALKASLCVDELVVFRRVSWWEALGVHSRFVGCLPDLRVVKIMVNYGGDEWCRIIGGKVSGWGVCQYRRKLWWESLTNVNNRCFRRMCVGSVVVRNVVNYGVEDFRGDVGRSTWNEERRKLRWCWRWGFAFKNFQTRLKHRGHLCPSVLSLYSLHTV